jgi:Ca-activated chloride channel family protein
MLKSLFVLALVATGARLLPAQGTIVQIPCNGPRCAPVACIRPGACQPGPANIIHESSAATVQLANGVLRYSVGEVLRNTGSLPGEVDYMFPLPKYAAFQDLAMSINGEMMAGEVYNADTARRIYESIVRANRDPALVEWMGHGLLRTRIFPIAPGEEKHVDVRFQAVARREGDAIRVDYFVGTRRGQGGGPNGTSTTLTFSYPDSARYGTPYSPTHSITGSRATRGTRTVTLSGSGSEMTLLLPIRNARTASISVVPHAVPGENGFALITLSPPQLAPRTTPRDVVFVLDVSGSMAGSKMDQAREAGRRLLATLRPTDRFRIVNFATDVGYFEPSFLPATRENLARARGYLDSLDASGSTNIMAALDEALRSFDGNASDRLPLVLFVTDGAPTVGEVRSEVIGQRASDIRGRARVFTFGVGADVKADLIEQLAVDGRGTAQMLAAGEPVDRAVELVASRLTSPVVTDLRLNAAGVRLERMHPGDVTDLFTGQDVVILARYTGSGRATFNFEGTSADGPVRWSTTVDLPAREVGNAFVSRLWATQRVGFLSAERRRNGANPELDQEIRTLGERFSIPTLFTSYMVVEPGVQVPPPLGRVTQDFTGRGAGRGGSGGGGAATGQVQGGQAQNTTGQQGAAASQASLAGRVGLAAKVAKAGPSDAANSARPLTAHESVRLDESLRQARSEADLDASISSGGTRRVGSRIFTLVDSTWIDVRHKDSLTVTKIKPYSQVYFELLKAVPELSPVFALGNKVLVAGKGVAIRLDESGVENMPRSEMDALAKKW